MRRETVAEDITVWHIPAKVKFGFFMLFAVLWLIITGFVSIGFLSSIATAGKS